MRNDNMKKYGLATAMDVHGKLNIISAVEADTNDNLAKIRHTCQALSAKGRPLYVIMVEIYEGWEGDRKVEIG